MDDEGKNIRSRCSSLRRPLLFAGVVLLICSATSGAHAQRSMGSSVGTLVSGEELANGEACGVLATADVRTFPAAEPEALFGGIIGGVAGLGLGAWIGYRTERALVSSGSENPGLAGLLIGAAAGAVIGGILGSRAFTGFNEPSDSAGAGFRACRCARYAPHARFVLGRDQSISDVSPHFPYPLSLCR